MRPVPDAMSACGEAEGIAARQAKQRLALRADSASSRSHGLASFVRLTSADTSCSFTASAPRCASAIFSSSAFRRTVSSPASSTKSRAAPSVSVMPCDTAIERTRRGSSLRFGDEQSMVAAAPKAATALPRRVAFDSFSPSSRSTVEGQGAPR